MKLGAKFSRCVKSVRKTIRPRKGSTKEGAAIAICTKTVLYPKGKTIKRYTKKRLTTQRRRKGGAYLPEAAREGNIMSVPDTYILLRRVQTADSLRQAASALEANEDPKYARGNLKDLAASLRRYADSARPQFHQLGASSVAGVLENDVLTAEDKTYIRGEGVAVRG